MSGTIRSSNPFFTIKPRRFFGERKESLTKQRMTTSGKLKYDPDWNKGKEN